ncbi:MAG: formylglycine-generating enzyme family protein [Colwellia sp.]
MKKNSLLVTFKSICLLFTSLVLLLGCNTVSTLESSSKSTKESSSNSTTVNSETINKSLTITKQSAADSKYQLTEKLHQQLLDDMVWIEAGSFAMGSDTPEARNRERPAHQVTLDGFYLSKFELTQDVFLQIMGWNNSFFQCAKCPLNNVSYFNMQLFIERLNMATGKKFRLPTEAEWEFAAKGGIHSKNYRFSGSDNITDVAWFHENSNRKAHPVGLKKQNELGLYDMTGNVWEFCQDDMYRNAYKRGEVINPVINDTKRNPKSKAMKVLRGGGYDFSAKESLVFIRDGATNNVRMADIGFRLAMSKQ